MKALFFDKANKIQCDKNLCKKYGRLLVKVGENTKDNKDFIDDNGYSLYFLIDTGSTTNFIFKSYIKYFEKQSIAIGKTDIKTTFFDGTKNHNSDKNIYNIIVTLGDFKEIELPFLEVDRVKEIYEEENAVLAGILGLPFLYQNNLIIDSGSCQCIQIEEAHLDENYNKTIKEVKLKDEIYSPIKINNSNNIIQQTMNILNQLSNDKSLIVIPSFENNELIYTINTIEEFTNK